MNTDLADTIDVVKVEPLCPKIEQRGDRSAPPGD